MATILQNNELMRVFTSRQCLRVYLDENYYFDHDEKVRFDNLPLESIDFYIDGEFLVEPPRGWSSPTFTKVFTRISKDDIVDNVNTDYDYFAFSSLAIWKSYDFMAMLMINSFRISSANRLLSNYRDIDLYRVLQNKYNVLEEMKWRFARQYYIGEDFGFIPDVEKVYVTERYEEILDESLSICRLSKFSQRAFAHAQMQLPVITDVLRASNNVANVLEEVVDKFPDRDERREILDAVNNASEKAEKLTDTTNNLSGLFSVFSSIWGSSAPAANEYHNKLMDSFNHGDRNITVSLVFVISLILHVRFRSWFTMSLLGVSFLAMFLAGDGAGICKQYFVQIFTQLPARDSKDVDVEMVAVAQMDAADLNLGSDLITGILCGSILKDNKKETKEAVKGFFKDFGTTRGGLSSFVEFSVKLVERVITYGKRTYYNDESLPSFKFLKTNNEEFDKWSKEVRTVCYSFNSRQFHWTSENKIRLDVLISVGKHLNMILPRDKFTSSSSLSKYIMEDLKSLYSIRVEFEKAGVIANGQRQEPAVLALFGGPGTGKSRSMQDAAYAACAKYLSEVKFSDFKQNPSLQIYNRVHEQVYWDGYVGSPLVTTFDDYGQFKDVAGTPDNEHSNMIRAVSGFPYSLHMAGMEGKGCTYFDSKFIVATSNLTTLNNIPSLISPLALKRRLHLMFVVTPKEAYVTEETRNSALFDQTFNYDALPKTKNSKGEDIPLLTTDAQWFWPVDKDFNLVGHPHTFDEVMVLWFKAHDTFKDIYEQNKLCFEATAAKYRPILDQPLPEIKMNDYVNLPDDYSFDGEGDICVMTEEDMKKNRIDYVYKLYVKEPQMLDFIIENVDPLATQKDLEMFPEAYMNWISENFEPDMFEWLLCRKRGIIPFTKIKIRKFRNKLVEMDEYLDENYPVYRWIKGCLSVLGGTAILAFVAFLATKLARKIFSFIYDTFFNTTAVAQSQEHDDKMKATKPVAKYFRNPQAMKAALNNAKAEGDVYITIKSDAIDNNLNDATISNEVNFVSEAVAQMGCDPNGVKLMNSIVKHNLVQFSSKFIDGKWYNHGKALMIHDTTALMPYHFVFGLFSIMQELELQDIDIRLTRINKRDDETHYYVTLKDIVDSLLPPEKSGLMDKDLVTVRFPKEKVQSFRSIVKNFVSLDTLKRDRKIFNAMLINDCDRSFMKATYHDTEKVISDGYDRVTWKIREYYAYGVPTVVGDCGSLFMKADSRIVDEKIYGIHVAGDNTCGEGYASPITQEELWKDLKAHGYMESVAQAQGGFGQHFQNIEVVRTLPRSECPSSALDSEIIPSPMYGCVGDALTAPARLHGGWVDGVYYNPMRIAYDKYDIPHPDLDEKNRILVQEAVDLYFSSIASSWRERNAPRVLTLEEALHGIENDPHFRGIAPSTSPGYSMKLAKNVDWKKKLFEFPRHSPEYNEVLEQYRLRHESFIKQMEKGTRLEWYYKDCLKDERKTHEKVATFNTRMFSGCDFDYLVLVRRYFGHFDSAFKYNRIDNWSAIGVNPYSVEWERIWKELTKFGDTKGGAGDHKKFDCNHLAEIHSMIAIAINHYFYYNSDLKDNNMRILLFKDISNSRHAVMDVIVEWKGSMPSGNPLTLIINTIYNGIAFTFVFVSVIEENPILEVYRGQLFKHLYVIIVGDDNTFGVSETFRPYINELTVPKYMARIHLQYTTENKDQAVSEFRDLYTVNFLKRMWRYDKSLGRHIAPIDLDVALEICYWTKENADYHSTCISNLEDTLNELSLHSSEVWLQYWPKLTARAREVYTNLDKMNLPLLTIQSLRKASVVDQQVYY